MSRSWTLVVSCLLAACAQEVDTADAPAGSDMPRTVVVGRPLEGEQATWWDAVRDAQAAGVALPTDGTEPAWLARNSEGAEAEEGEKA